MLGGEADSEDVKGCAFIESTAFFVAWKNSRTCVSFPFDLKMGTRALWEVRATSF